MNVYLIISEELKTAVYEDWFVNAGHWEYYRIAELVVAQNRGQARWLAWKGDGASFTGDVRDMPRMTCRMRAKNIEWFWPMSGIVTDRPEFQGCWGKETEEIPIP